MNQDQIWRDEKTGLPIHVHFLTGESFEPVRKPCDCGQSIFDISKSELIKKRSPFENFPDPPRSTLERIQNRVKSRDQA